MTIPLSELSCGGTHVIYSLAHTFTYAGNSPEAAKGLPQNSTGNTGWAVGRRLGSQLHNLIIMWPWTSHMAWWVSLTWTTLQMRNGVTLPTFPAGWGSNKIMDTTLACERVLVGLHLGSWSSSLPPFLPLSILPSLFYISQASLN